MEKYISFDTETGGFNPELHSLLELSMALHNHKLDQIDELNIKIKPDDGIYRVTAEALFINKINLVEHDKQAVTYSEAAKLLYYKLKEWSDNGAVRLTPLGHNEAFDERFITSILLKPEIWKLFVDYFAICTAMYAKTMIAKGKLPKGTRIKLSLLAKTLDIKVDQNALHGAKYDRYLCVEVFKKLLEL